jgi:hypothetical protein
MKRCVKTWVGHVARMSPEPFVRGDRVVVLVRFVICNAARSLVSYEKLV